MANQPGKRCLCSVRGSSVVCTKSDEGVISCCDAEMELQQLRQLPYSD